MTIGVVLAAGAGRRAGGPKALRHDHDGASWLRRSADSLLDGGCEQVVVVLGASAPAAAGLLTDTPRVSAVVAADWETGLSASLRRGLQAVSDHGDATACVHLVDLTDVTAAVIARVLQHDRGPATLARASYGGRPGHPVVVGRHHLLPMIATLGGDQGGRRYLARSQVIMVECGDLATGHDVDAAPITLGQRVTGA